MKISSGLYYAPNNAFLAIAGDIDPAQAKTWVTKYFGDIPRGKPVRGPRGAGDAASEHRLVYEDRVQVARLYIQWPTVGEKNDDHYALDVLGAILRGRARHGLPRLWFTISQAAASVSVYQDSNEDVGEFYLLITPVPATR